MPQAARQQCGEPQFSRVGLLLARTSQDMTIYMMRVQTMIPVVLGWVVNFLMTLASACRY